MVTYSGERNPFWKGGRSIASNGYVLVRVGIDHPLADVRGYAYEHRLVASEKLGRLISKEEHVHHIDGDKTNNAPENLQVLTEAEHRLAHRKVGSNRRNPGEPNPLIQCACGCGRCIYKFDNSGRPRKYISGHNSEKITDEKITQFIGQRLVTVKQIAQHFEVGIQTVQKMMPRLQSENKIFKFKGKFYCLVEFKDLHAGNPLINCACGCGQTLKRFDVCGRSRRFISGHNLPEISKLSGGLPCP